VVIPLEARHAVNARSGEKGQGSQVNDSERPASGGQGTAELPATSVTSLDRNSPVPLYYQVAQRLEREILDGILPVGTRLDNEVALAQRYGVSRPTVRQAISNMVDRGLLIRRRGIGTLVGPSTQVKRPLSLTSLYDDLAEAGHEPSTRVLGIGPVGATAEVAAQLDLAEGTPVTLIRRLRYARDEPIALMRSFLLAEFDWITKAQLEATGMYRLLQTNGIDLRLASQTIAARAARPEEAELLRMEPGAPLLTMRRTAFDVTGRPVEYSSHVYPADRYAFEMSLVSR
jgi:GntR family transcriptional regulator